MSAVPTTVSPQSSQQPSRQLAHRAARDGQVRPSVVRALLGVVLLLGALVVWSGAMWMTEGRGWDDGAVVGARGTEVAVAPGEEWVLWKADGAPEGTPDCRATDVVFGHDLAFAALADPVARTVGGNDWNGGQRITGAADQVRVTCRGDWAGQVAVAPAPEGVALFRDGRWAVLVAFVLGGAGAALLGREVLEADLLVPRRSEA